MIDRDGDRPEESIASREDDVLVLQALFLVKEGCVLGALDVLVLLEEDAGEVGEAESDVEGARVGCKGSVALEHGGMFVVAVAVAGAGARCGCGGCRCGGCRS